MFEGDFSHFSLNRSNSSNQVHTTRVQSRHAAPHQQQIVLAGREHQLPEHLPRITAAAALLCNFSASLQLYFGLTSA